jgi:hypothetical protein
VGEKNGFGLTCLLIIGGIYIAGVSGSRTERSEVNSTIASPTPIMERVDYTGPVVASPTFEEVSLPEDRPLGVDAALLEEQAALELEAVELEPPSFGDGPEHDESYAAAGPSDPQPFLAPGQAVRSAPPDALRSPPLTVRRTQPAVQPEPTHNPFAIIPSVHQPPVYVQPVQPVLPGCTTSGSCYGDISIGTGRPRTVHVRGYTRRDGTYVRPHYRSAPRRRY